jgi:hypothetical protein
VGVIGLIKKWLCWQGAAMNDLLGATWYKKTEYYLHLAKHTIEKFRSPLGYLGVKE